MVPATGNNTFTPILRHLSAADLAAGRRFAARLGVEDVRLRFGIGLRNVPRLAEKLFLLGRANSESYAVLDADGEIAAIGNFVQVASRQAEFALVVRPDCKRRGLASLLLNRLSLRARQRGIHLLTGWVLAENAAMIALARKHGARFGQAAGSQIEMVFNLVAERPPGSRVADLLVPATGVQPVPLVKAA